MQRFTAIFLVALVALLGLSTPVHAIPARADTLAKRGTNAERFARGLPPLPPTKRSPTASTWLMLYVEEFVFLTMNSTYS
jgi:hypothetical protein